MGWNGAGSVIRTDGVRSGSDVHAQQKSASVKVRADLTDYELEDLATAIETAVARDGQNAASANLPMGGFKHTGVATGSGAARSEYASGATVQDGALHDAGDTGGTSTAYTATLAPAITAYADKQLFRVKFNATCGATPTIAFNGLAAKKIYRLVGTTATQVTTSEIPQNLVAQLRYDAALDSASGGFWLLNPPPDLMFTTSAAGTAQTLTSTDAGASEGPDLDLYRNSASPAANDVIGGIVFNGKDDAGNKQLYGRIRAVITDPGSASEDGKLVLSTVVAGSETDLVTVEGGSAKTGLYVAGNPVTLPLLQTLTASTSASLRFTGADNTKYRGYLFLFHKILPASTGTDLWLRASSDQGASLRSGTEYAHARVGGTSAPVAGAAGSNGDTKIVIASTIATTSSIGISGTGTILLNTAAYDFEAVWQSFHYDGSNVTAYAGGGNSSQASLNGFGFLMSSGNITSGTVYVYGIPKV